MIICGMDEVGRGSLAGPIVAAAVVLNEQFRMYNLQLKDSKKLTEKQRNKIYKQLVNAGAIFAVEMISVRLINTKGIGWANKEVFRRLIKRVAADKYIVDGNLKIKGAISMVKADSKVPEVMAASIIAKVTRDEQMIRLHDEHQAYGWKSNKGYGTRYHIAAIKEYGSTRYHRSLFVRTALLPHPLRSPLQNFGEGVGGEVA